MTNIQAFAASAAGTPLEPFEFEAAAPASHEVRVAVSHCGICHSDLHLLDDEWRMTKFPFVPGHEVIGHIEALGSEVQHLGEGQRVGIGWQSGACMTCEWCADAQENLCQKKAATCVGRHGGFASHLTVDSQFAFAIPEQLASENAAPLLCGGITVYSPLQRLNVRHFHRVGIVGIGGLGHLAVQFAAAMGAEVTAFSTSESKAELARSLGATHVVDSTDPAAMKQAKNSLDFILVTATADLDWRPYINALRTNGKMCFVTGARSSVDVPVGVLVNTQKTITGSTIGGRSVMAEMLDFAARNDITAMTEVLPAAQVNEAIERVRNNDVRFRMVLEM